MKLKLLFLLLLSSTLLFAQDIMLPTPQTHGGLSVMEALSKRESTRSFSTQAFHKQELSNLLWAAWGYNRTDKRTAPSSQNKQEMDLYVFIESGIYLYDAKLNKLIEIRKGDYRELTGQQSFVKDAPVNIVFVANREKMTLTSDEQQLATASVNAGYISENIYLYCAAFNLGTVARGSIPKMELREMMNLSPAQIIILAQSVGHKVKK